MRRLPLVYVALETLVVAGAYFVSGLLALAYLTVHHKSAAAFWPAAGIAFAALLLRGSRCAGGVFLGAFFLNLCTEGNVATSLGIACGNTLEAFLAVLLCVKFAGGARAFIHPRGYFVFVLLSCLLSTVPSPIIGVTSLALGGYAPWDNFWNICLIWWLGDSVGMMVIAPFLVLWLTIRWQPVRWSALLRFATVTTSVGVLSWLVFFGKLPGGANLPAAFLVLPLLVLGAYRFRARRATALIVLMAFIAMTGSLNALGPFGSMSHDVTLTLVQLFVACTTVTVMELAATAAERHRAEGELRQIHNELEERVQERALELSRANEALRKEITDRRNAELRFRSFLESAPDAILIVNQQGKVVLANVQAEKLFGFLRSELLGRPVELLMPERFRAIHEEHRGRYFTHPATRPMGTGMALWGLRKSGQEFPVEISLSPLITEQGTLVSAAIRDTTARREVEEKLRQAERLAAIGEMITGMAHESRNALQRSKACLEMLRLEVPDRPRALDLMGRMKKAQDHLQHLYEEVRQYAAPIVLDRQPCRLGEIVHEAWKCLLESGTRDDVHLCESGSGANLVCQADRVSVGQVFRNILENALAASPEHGEIDVCWSETSVDSWPAVRVAFHDSGPGLKPEQRERVFEPFFTTKAQGTGLGLAIAKRIVEAHGGRIAVGSNNMHGAEIVVDLPRGTS